MRPRLHPDMGTTVLCARVALKLTYRAWVASNDIGLSPATIAYRCSSYLPLDYPGFLKFALHSLAVYLNLGWTSSQWLESVLKSAHDGSSFRRCFFFDYKENRCSYPRVTNRGVQTSLKADGRRVKKGRVNA